MKLKDFDFRVWDNEDNLYLEQKYTKRFNCYEAKGYEKWHTYRKTF